ncbi:hypothetical protein [Halomicrobium urmianum]|uniref:hypothetical protein n=1 Tax=Halomicrobium urmianum TaxID=1586233 RepID=UPI00402B6608
MPASETLEPVFGCVRFDVAEAIRERRRSALEFSKNPFDSIPISVARYLKPEACSLECSLEVLNAINEKFGCFDVVFLLEFAEKYFGESGGRRRKKPDVKQLVRSGIASGVQPELLIVDPLSRPAQTDSEISPVLAVTRLSAPNHGSLSVADRHPD